MTKRTQISVSPSKNGGWDLKKSNETLSHHRNKDTAIERGRALGNKTDNSQLLIKGKDGRIQTEHTYGNDPKKYPG